MICISRRSWRRRLLSSASTSWPANVICPAVGSIKRNRQRPTVDLPQPDSPTSPSVSPAKMSNETPSTARTTSSEPSTGKCFIKPRTLTSVPGIAGVSPALLALVASFDTCRRAACGPRLLIAAVLLLVNVIGCHRRGQIVKHTTHDDAAFELIKRNRSFSAARHPMRTARREVTTRRQISGARHDTFDRFQPLLFNHVVAGEL